MLGKKTSNRGRNTLVWLAPKGKTTINNLLNQDYPLYKPWDYHCFVWLHLRLLVGFEFLQMCFCLSGFQRKQWRVVPSSSKCINVGKCTFFLFRLTECSGSLICFISMGLLWGAGIGTKLWNLERIPKNIMSHSVVFVSTVFFLRSKKINYNMASDVMF